MEGRRITRSMTSSQNDSSSKRLRVSSPSAPPDAGPSRTPPPDAGPSRPPPRKLCQACIVFLHSDNCMETPENLSEMSRKLNQNPELLEKTQCNKDTPLISAVKRGHEKCVKFLLKYEPNLDAVNAGNENALCFAVHKYNQNIPLRDKFYNIMKMLLDCGSDPNWVKPRNDNLIVQYKSQIFKLVIISGHVRLVKLFLNYKLDTFSQNNYKDISYLDFAILTNKRNVDSEIIKLLLENGANLNFGSKYNLSLTIRHGYPKTIKYIFLYHGSPIYRSPRNTLYNTSFCNAVFRITHLDLEKKLKIIRTMYQFGINLWKNELQRQYESEDEYNFYNEVDKIRGEPLSLKSLSRIKILYTMRRNFVKKYKELEIPISLHEFLEFPDV